MRTKRAYLGFGRVLSPNSPDGLAPEAQVAALRLGARSSPPVNLIGNPLSFFLCILGR